MSNGEGAAWGDGSPRPNSEDYVVIRSFPNVTEAHLAAGLLESAGIAVQFSDEYAANLYPRGAPTGGVKLLVPRSAVAEAEAIFAERPEVVIFACVHNAGRSQMAASFFNQLADPAKAYAVSAGTRPGARVHPEVVDVMREVGIDLADAQPRELTGALSAAADYLVTMGCGEECPHVPGVTRDDWALDDPKGQPLDRVRAIRDDIHGRVASLLAAQGWRPGS
jgi:arsenate reductase